MRIADPSTIEQMRKLAHMKQSPSAILRNAYDRIPSESRNKIALIELFKNAFCLALHEASPIAGWDVNGEGELKDEQLDELLIPALEKHRGNWDGHQDALKQIGD